MMNPKKKLNQVLMADYIYNISAHKNMELFSKLNTKKYEYIL